MKLQVSITISGKRFRADALINGCIILEVNGEGKYEGRFGVRPEEEIKRERQREKLLQNAGYLVVRGSAAAIYQDLRRIEQYQRGYGGEKYVLDPAMVRVDDEYRQVGASSRRAIGTRRGWWRSWNRPCGHTAT